MNQRAALLWVWIGGYIACIALLFSMFFKGLSVRGNLVTQFVLLSTIYMPYIGTIFGYWFSKKKSAVDTADSRHQFLVAVVMSIVFQAVVIIILASEWSNAERGGIESALKVASQITTGIALVTAGPIGYFFGKEKS